MQQCGERDHPKPQWRQRAYYLQASRELAKRSPQEPEQRQAQAEQWRSFSVPDLLFEWRMQLEPGAEMPARKAFRHLRATEKKAKLRLQ